MFGEGLLKSFFIGVLLNIILLTANATMLDNEGAIVKLLTDKKAPQVLESKCFSRSFVDINTDLLTEYITGHNVRGFLDGVNWNRDTHLVNLFFKRYESTLREACWYYVGKDMLLVIVDHAYYSASIESLMQHCREKYMEMIYDEDGLFRDNELASVQTSIDLAVTRESTKKANVNDALRKLQQYSVSKGTKLQNCPAFYECLVSLDERLGQFIRDLTSESDKEIVEKYNALMLLLRS